jgi:1-acyl-sn-glycerol-3-phosphate acyltransferase
MPFIRTFLRKMGHYAFDRSDPKARVRQAEQIEETLKRGESVLVFPEGTFTAYEGLRPFQLGAFKAALEAGCPVCPVALRGTREFLRDGTYLPRPRNVSITISVPIETDRPKAAGNPGSESSSDWREIVRLRDASREAIARNCGEPLL